MSLPKEAFCSCCEGSGKVAEGSYTMTPEECQWILSGKDKTCPGCDGEGVSVRAKLWRKENNFPEVKMNEDSNLKLASRLTRVASISLGEQGDTLWVVRHYTGSGACVRLIEVHVIRNQKFLGRFEIQEVLTFDAAWQSASDAPKVSEAEIVLFRKARKALLSLVENLWPD